MFGIGVTELGIILVVALLVFGPKRLPELARTLGRGMGEFRKASNELRQSLALDDLQNDLRKDLNRAGTIHKPPSPDKPQASATPQPPGKAGDAPDPATTGGPQPLAAPASATIPHPGELPLDNDHEHNEMAEEQPIDDSIGADAASNRSKVATPADPGLGNVPVSDSDPVDPERG